jgi:hypothetical protein
LQSDPPDLERARRAMAERINAAFEAGDIVDICLPLEPPPGSTTSQTSRAALASKAQASIARSRGEKSARISARF